MKSSPTPARSGLHLAIAMGAVLSVGLLLHARGSMDVSQTVARSTESSSTVELDRGAGTVSGDVYSPGASLETPSPATTVVSNRLVEPSSSQPGVTTTTPTPVAPSTSEPALMSREIPDATVASSPPEPGPWASVTRTTPAGFVSTDLGCAAGTSASALDAFFAERVGPVLGEDYQHVYQLGPGRHLWVFQDTFVDHSGQATRLDAAAFVHNAAMIQDGSCFTMLHRGTTADPLSFEPGSGELALTQWFWPMGGEVRGGQLYLFWAQMQSDGYQPQPGDGLGWHPVQTWLGVYDATSLQRQSFRPAANPGVVPIYGYAVSTQGDYTYLFGNTFEQNLVREGGFASGPHSATAMYLARVPSGNFGAMPEYRTADGWTFDETKAVPIVQRFWAENPMQPRFMNGQWVSVTKVDGYWGEQLAVDVAADPWGPWTTVDLRQVVPRGGDPLMNTYHAYLMPWLSDGGLVVSISQNARDMTRNAYPVPSRYRIGFFPAALVPPPAPPPDTTTSTTIDDTTTTESTTTTTIEPETTTTTIDDTTTTESTTTTSTTTTSTTTSSTTTTVESTTTTTAPDDAAAD